MGKGEHGFSKYIVSGDTRCIKTIGDMMFNVYNIRMCLVVRKLWYMEQLAFSYSFETNGTFDSISSVIEY